MFQINVGSLLEIYTTIFGWSLYNTFYDLLRITGVIYFPFIMLLYKNWKDPVLSQNDKSAAITSQSRIQYGLISAMLIFSFAVLPFANLSLDNVTYRKICSDPSGAEIVKKNTNGTSETKYSSNIGANTQNQVQVPVFWWFVLAFSSGINNAVNSSISCFEDLKGVDQQLRNLTIKDEALRKEYVRFSQECFIPANSRYNDSLKGVYGSQHQEYVIDSKKTFLENNTDLDNTDMFFIGSHYFQETEGFYSSSNQTPANCANKLSKCSFRADNPVNGWPYLNTRDLNYTAEDIANNTNGKPYCDEWWNTTQNNGNEPLALKRKLLNSIEASDISMLNWDENKSLLLNISDSLRSGYANVFFTDEEIEDLIIKRYVTIDPPSMLGSLDHANPFAGDEFAILKAGGAAVSGATAVAFFPVVALGAGSALLDVANSLKDFYMMMFIAKSVAPMIQAIILMMLYALMIFYLVMAEYEIDSIITMMFLILAVRFFTPLWSIADYLDAALFEAMYPDPIVRIGTILTQGLNRLFLDMVLMITYVAVPTILLAIMAMAGVNVGGMAKTFGAMDSPSRGAGKFKVRVGKKK